MTLPAELRDPFASSWVRVTRSSPCPICSHDRWCVVAADGRTAVCMRTESARLAADGKGWVHILEVAFRDQWTPPPVLPRAAAAAAPPVLHEVYGALLAALHLSAEHRAHLTGRGLTDAELARRGYGSLPLDRWPAIRRLKDTFPVETLLRVPGFRADLRGRVQLGGRPGLLIPSRDQWGRVVALVVRPDLQEPGRPKYLYLSSAKHGGPSPGAPCHVPLFEGDCSFIRITEGVLKADVATALSGVFTLGVPGVASWRTCLPVVEHLGPARVGVAFDADAAENEHVRRYEDELIAALQEVSRHA